MSKVIRISKEAHKTLNDISLLTGIKVADIIDKIIEEKTSKDTIKNLTAKMREV